MLKYCIMAFVILLNVVFLNAAYVEVDSNIYKDKTEFIYYFNFSEEDSYKSFSFERPEGASIEYILSSNELSPKYSLAGDFVIVQPLETESNSFEIKLISKTVSEKIISDRSFIIYLNFNFPVESLQFKVNLIDDFGEINKIVPRDYTITDKGEYFWIINNVETDTLFFLDFGGGNFPSNNSSKIYYLIGILVVIFIIITVYIASLRKKHKKTVEDVKKEAKKEKTKLKKSLEKSQSDNTKLIKKDKKISKAINDDKKEDKIVEAKTENSIEEYDEIINKFLTDNEKEVVRVVKENQGISQYDILNHLPSLTKSNLSKIISKLNSRKFLNKIRVGKVNKIYLGEKLEEEQTPKD